MTSGGPHPRAAWLPAALWSGATVLVASLVGRFWIPLDDGTLAQSAERVMSGQLPHVDFGDPYTGLNAMVGALSFRLFGVHLAALRIPLVVGFAAWLPAVWMVARRFAPPRVALVGASLAALLSVLTYPAAMPTWFALFAVTWGLAFLLAWVDGRGRPWLAAAGAAAGVATLFKVVGLYFLAACLLTGAWHRARGSASYRAVALVGCAAFLVVLAALLAPVGGLATAATFYAPALAVCAAVVVRSWQAPADRVGGGVAPLLRDGAALLAGLALPVAVFLVPYALRGGVPAWLDGVFLRPGLRFESAASPPGGVWTLLCGAALVTVLAAAGRLEGAAARRAGIAVAGALALLWAADDALDGLPLELLWYALRTATPSLVVWGAWRLRGDAAAAAAAGPAFATLVTAALWSLVQFPYAAPAYFFYVAPLTVLAVLAVTALPSPGAARSPRPGPAAAVLAGVAAWLGAGYAFGVVTTGTRPLDVARGGIRVSEADAAAYADLIQTIETHVGDGALWAGPDAPEIYFLTGLPNRTRVLYEFLSSDPAAEPRALTDPDVTVAVENTRPLFSAPLDGRARERLAERFPGTRVVGAWVVRWRSP